MEQKTKKQQMDALAEPTINPKLIVILESANLETVKRRDRFQLLNCDDHWNIIKKNGKSPNECRPDITHQCLLTLLDSPLNKAGYLQVYIHTAKNVLIEINPRTRIPRTFKRFSGLMVQLLFKMSIRASDGNEKLLKVIKNPVTDHLPPGSRKIGLSEKGDLIDIDDYVSNLPEDEPVVMAIGAYAHGRENVDYVEEEIAISSFNLSASVCCGKVTSAFEKKLGVL
eukprot:TRINITY_DN95_c0_g1_i1.p1 TRINITY_DN95_c0_g1~~TRINITY_DN95_c0_g1_i1.p1  ORF type:complete len:226 (-),score=73.31 TRINITY_DN95_c0_g1_i1:280-957(-)